MNNDSSPLSINTPALGTSLTRKRSRTNDGSTFVSVSPTVPSEIDSANNNTIIFTLARMNPPTPGHLYLIQRLIEEAINNNVSEVFIILSKTTGDNENPIQCPQKIEILGEENNMITKTMINTLKTKMISEIVDPVLKSKIRDITVHTICVPEVPRATPFTPLITIVNEKSNIPDLNLILIIGDDRRDMIDSIRKYFSKYKNVTSVDGIILPREEMSDFKEKSKDPEELDKLNMAEVPINAISASFVRNIVKNERKDKFRELYLPYLNEDKIDTLYDSILTGVQSFPPPKKKGGNKTKKKSNRKYKKNSKTNKKRGKKGTKKTK